MNKRQQRRILESRLRAVRGKKKEIDKKLSVIGATKNRIVGLIGEMSEFNHSNDGADVRMHQARIGDRIDINSSTGIWIVGNRELMRDCDSVSLTKFYDLVNEEEKPLTMRVQLPKVQMIGSDGKEVTFNPGDLVSCDYEGDLHEGKHAFHFANIEPSSKEGRDMYDTVRIKLGLKINRTAVYTEPRSYMVVDGNFRKVVN